MSDPLVQSYVWHKGQKFLVSTINRLCSSVLAPDLTYAETMAWELDPTNNDRMRLLWQGEAFAGALREHERAVRALFSTGEPPAGEVEDV
jgi:hypothetical protein